MATSSVHLPPVPDGDDLRSLPGTAESNSTALQEFVGLLAQTQEDRALKRARHTRRTEEILSNQGLLTVEAYAIAQAGRRLINDRMGTAITRIIRRFDALIADLGPSLSEDQLKLIQIAKDDFIAAEYEEKERTLKILSDVVRTTLVTALSRPENEFRRRSAWESFWAGVTMDRSLLKERGLPPLSVWEEMTDDLGLSNHTERRLRADERSRRQAFLTLLAGPEDSYGADN